MAMTTVDGSFLLRRRLAEAARGNADACFELGLAYSAGIDGADADFIQAHKWFNLAALSGDVRSQEYRADLAAEMSARDIAEAQRQARAWILERTRKAA